MGPTLRLVPGVALHMATILTLNLILSSLSSPTTALVTTTVFYTLATLSSLAPLLFHRYSQPESLYPSPDRKTWEGVDDATREWAMATGDPPADTLIARHPHLAAAIISSPHPLATAQDHVDDAPRVMADLIHHLSWGDDGVRDGQGVYERNAGFLGLGLLVALLESFTFPLDASVLVATGALTGDLERAAQRALDTGVFIESIMDPERSMEDVAGECLRIRLVHARARAFVASCPDWNVGPEYVPINQATMAATLVLFCQVSLEASTTMGAVYSRRDRNLYWAWWARIGVLLGIDPRLIPDSYDAGLEARNSPMYLERMDPNGESAKLISRMIAAIHQLPTLPFDPPVFAISLRLFWPSSLVAKLDLPPVPVYAWLLWAARFAVYWSVTMLNAVSPVFQRSHSSTFTPFMRTAYGYPRSP